MQQKSDSKQIMEEQKNQPCNKNNKNPQIFKNLYSKIRKNIKTSFQNPKQKNSFYLINSKMLSENPNKKKNNRNINMIFNKKEEESRNFNSNNVEKIFNNQDEEYNDNDDIYYFNKTQKNVKYLYSKYSKKKINNKRESKNNIKNSGNLKKSKNNINNNSNKHKNLKEYRKVTNNKFYSQNKNVKSNKEIKDENLGNNNEYYDIKSKKNEKERKNSIERNSKLLINNKLISKEDFIKNKIIFDKVKSARLANYDINKLNLNVNNDIIRELKTDSSKKTVRINSQKLVKINENEFETETINQIKKIKKNKLIRQLTKQTSKNHSMNINTKENSFLLNDNIKNNLKKTKNKFSIANIYNYPNINNNLKNIPFDKDIIFDSADKKNNDNSGNIYFNNYYNMDHTCINFNNMNNTLNNNGALNNTNEKNTPKSNYPNISFGKPYSQEKISSFHYSKPVARLKKRIFNSPSDKDLDNSINNYEINNYDFDKKYKDYDTLEEIKEDKNNVNSIFKKLLISIKILNQIIITQNKIIKQNIKNINNLRKEIEEKNKQVKDYKGICLKLMLYLKNENEINLVKEYNKKRIIIQKQLLKENYTLRILLSFSKINYTKNNNNKSFYISNNKEGESSINIYHLKKEENNNQFKKIDYNSIKNITENSFNSLYNNNIFLINKKREKSYENKKNKKNKDVDIKINYTKHNIDGLEENTKKANKKICYIVKDKNNSFEYEKNII